MCSDMCGAAIESQNTACLYKEVNELLQGCLACQIYNSVPVPCRFLCAFIFICNTRQDKKVTTGQRIAQGFYYSNTLLLADTAPFRTGEKMGNTIFFCLKSKARRGFKIFDIRQTEIQH